MCMNDDLRNEILVKNIKTLEDAIKAIKQNKSNINVIIKELEGVKEKIKNQKEEFSKKISEIEENIKNEIEKLRDEFKNNVLNEFPNTEKNNFSNSFEETFPSCEKLEDKKEVKEENNLNFGNENQEIELKKENLDLKERLENLKNEKIKEIGEKDQRISELTEKNTELEEKNKKLEEKNKKLEEEKNEKIDEIKKISKDLNQEKDNFDNLKTEFLKLKEEIKSRDVKINNLLREKANLEKNVDDLSQTITHLENQVSSLTKDVKNGDNKILGLEKDKYELENDKNNLISRLADFKDLEELEALYSEYLKIPENDREKYDAILKPHLGKDMFLYLVTTKFSNYKDFLKNDFIENADFYAVLVKIYDYVINVMNKEYDEEVYEFVNPEIGERYNPISQIPSSNSVSNGEVARVIVKGYQRKRDKKLLYQSIVLLK